MRAEQNRERVSSPAADDDSDTEMDRIVGEEEKVLARVQRTLEARRTQKREVGIDYDAELISLRDQIQEARAEDIPPLIEEMERLQQVAARRAKVTEGVVDPASPYFGRLVLEEDGKRREVLIGRSTFLDPTTGIRIVDWRDAPVSRVYYRYEEGDDYDENFGGRDVLGEVLVRRSVVITDRQLKRIGSPQGTFIRDSSGKWRRAGASATRLSGGQGAAMRPEAHHKPGKLGVGVADDREDKFLAEITALIDRRQFELISRPTSGLVVIQGGAGSGKTTIGLHRLAYLAFQDPKRFRPERMMVVVFNDALARYISKVLPALGVEGVPVVTYERWARKLRTTHFATLPDDVFEDVPSVVARFKKHPVLLHMIDRHAGAIASRVDAQVLDVGKKLEGGGKALNAWRSSEGLRPAQRVEHLLGWLGEADGDAQKLPLATRHALERVLGDAREEVRDVVAAWADVLTDKPALVAACAEHAPGAFSDAELEEIHAWCTRRCTMLLAWRDEEPRPSVPPGEQPPKSQAEADAAGEREELEGVDGEDVEEPIEKPALDAEDDTLLLRLWQRMRGPLVTPKKRDPLRLEHVFVDEAQDLSPVELAIVLETVSEQKSVTLAGDVAQRLLMDNGFTDWRGVLAELGMAHVEIEPLRLSYRSTHEILEFSRDVLGPLRSQSSGSTATRHGAPVELFQFAHSGDAVGFLGEALRELAQSEPRASIAVIARYPEQADLYYRGLVHAEVPNLRRIAEQDFPFKAGVDVTDVRQVKGLEFDYVVLVEASSASYPEDDESRHLMHIGATRAAHQLWVMSTATPTKLLPDDLRQRGY